MESLDNLDNPNEVQVLPVALKWGAIGGLLSIVWSQVSLMTGMTTFVPDEQAAGMSALSSVVGFAIVIVAVVMAVKEIKAQQGGYISFGKAFGGGYLASIVIALFAALYLMVYFNVIDPDALSFIQDSARDGMEDSGLSDEQIDEQMGMMETFTSPMAITLMGFFGSAIIYAIISLIIAAVMKKDRAF